LPNFRFKKALDMARGVKVFLNPQRGPKREAQPDREHDEDQAEKPRKNVLEQGKPEIGALPDFVVIGAQKCGTTFFYRLLGEHPNVQPPTGAREVHYFDHPERFDKGIEWYRRCFPPPRWQDGRRSITGEKSPSYLFHPHAAKRMSEAVPEARLIVLLRNPVDRAYSHYHHTKRQGFETLRFEEAIEAEETRLRSDRDRMLEDEHFTSPARRRYSYRARGVYVDQLLRWSEFFPEEQMLVLKSEDFFERTTDTLKLVQGFLGLPYRKLDLQRGKQKPREPMDPATRRRLEEYFEPHNDRLYAHLGRDFGW
jgi:hypothetical protein